MVSLNSNTVQKTMIKLFQGSGVCNDSTNHVVSSIIETSLRGVDSHGINLFPHYFRAVNAGRINKKPNIKIEQKGTSVVTIDADHAFGHHSGAVAIEQAIKIAKTAGIGAASVKNSSHFGAAAYFGLKAAKEGCLGFAFTNADSLVKVYGSPERFFGTNPICVTAPLKNEEPFCLDMATSLVSWNKIKLCAQDNQLIPEHWAFDKNGNSITDPKLAYSLNPIGEYKGFGLGLVVDILCALLADAPISSELLPMFTSPIEEKRYVSHFFMAMDIAKFTDLMNFKNRLQDMVDSIRHLKPQNGLKKVFVAGDPEKLKVKERALSGIPMANEKFNEFLAISNLFTKDVIH